MKNIKIILFISIISIILNSCDQINPYNSKRQLYLDTSINDPNYIDTSYISNDLPSQSIKKNAFLIEFTGYRCGQCPPAAELAHKYKESYHDKISLMSVHSGGFAKPLQSYFVDFQNADADLIYNLCGTTNNPAAALNYRKYDGSTTIVTDFTKSSLDPKINSLINEDADMDLELKLNKSSYKYILNAKVRYLKNVNNELHNIAVYVVEDSIVTWQLDYRDTDKPWKQFYEHNSVFRISIKGILGVPLIEKNVLKGQTIIKSFVYYLDPIKTNINKLRFIACVIDKTSYEVKQVIEIK